MIFATLNLCLQIISNMLKSKNFDCCLGFYVTHLSDGILKIHKMENICKLKLI